MKSEKYFNGRERKLIKLLSESEDYVTSSFLAEQLDISTRTIKSDIKKLNMKTMRFGFTIDAKHRHGYHLTVTDSNLYESFTNALYYEKDASWFHEIPQNRTQRINYIILKLLSVDYYIRLDDLAEEMSIEKSTLQACMNDVRIILAKYHLRIETVYKRGVILVGSEIDIRICMAEYYFHNSTTKNILTEESSIFANESSQTEIRQIKKILSTVLKNHQIHISNYSFENMTIHIYIATRRWILYNYVKCDKHYRSYIQESKELKAGIELKSALEKAYNIMLPFDEAIYFAIHFKTKHIENDFYMQQGTEIKEVLSEILHRIHHEFGLDLHQNEQLIQLLTMHLPTMISRLRLNMTLRNVLAYEYFRKYILSFLITKEVYKVIEEHYHLKIDVNEFGFLVLYFNLALEEEFNKKKLNLLLITGTGRPEGIVLLNSIKERFSQRIERIDMATDNAKRISDIEHYDLIVSTFPVHAISKPVILFGLNDQENFTELEYAINSLYVRDFDIRKIFPAKNFFTQLSVATKFDVFEIIRTKLKGIVNRNVMEEAFEIDNYLSGEIGNLTVLLHLENKTKTTECFCFILKKPIIWDKQYVRYIFALSNDPENIWECKLICQLLQSFIEHINHYHSEEMNFNYEDLIKRISLSFHPNKR